MSSLKMTFSLASLVLLMAFVAMPVMAHNQVTPADTTDHQRLMQIPMHAHPVIKSITAPKYTGGGAFEITVVFEAADADKKIAAPVVLDSDNIRITSAVFTVPLEGADLTTQVIRFVSTTGTT